MIDGDELAGADDSALSEQVAEEKVLVETEGGEVENTDEAEARAMGWVPEEEFKGDKKPRKFLSAAEFLERGQTVLPIVNAENKRLKAERIEADRQWEERFQRMERVTQAALKKQREKLEADFDARKREAVKLGDEEGYDAAVKAERKALQEFEEEPDETSKIVASSNGFFKSPAEVSAYKEWQGENGWFSTDEELTTAMDIAFTSARKSMPAASIRQQLEAAKERVAKIYPEKFGEKRRVSSVESGSRVLGGGAKGKRASDLPAEAKSAGMKFVEDGIYKDLESYAKDYFEEA